jgi:hypothetical protein
MDFAASRETEQKSGWRTRIGQVLREFGVVVFDPWNKPEVGYGKETAGSTGACDAWTFEDSPDGAQKRANLTGHYWETLHIDLRVADNGRLHYRLLPHQRLQRRDRARNRTEPARAQTCSLRQSPDRVSDLRQGGGFGFQLGTAIDERERRRRPVRPLLPFLEKLNKRLPLKWDNRRKTYVRQ